MVIGFIVHLRALWWSWCSFGRALGVVGFIRVQWVNSGVPWGRLLDFGSLGSFGPPLDVVGSFRSTLRVIVFLRAWPGCCQVHFGSLDSFGQVVELIRMRPGCRRIHSCVPWCSSGL